MAKPKNPDPKKPASKPATEPQPAVAPEAKQASESSATPPETTSPEVATPPVAVATETSVNDAPPLDADGNDVKAVNYSEGQLQNGEAIKVAHEGHPHGVDGSKAESQAKRAYLGSHPSGFQYK